MPESMPESNNGGFKASKRIVPELKPYKAENEEADSVEVDPVYDAEAALAAEQAVAERKAAQKATRARIEAEAIEVARKKAQELGGTAKGYDIPTNDETPGTGFKNVNPPPSQRKKGFFSRLFS